MTTILLHLWTSSIETMAGGHPSHDRHYYNVTAATMSCYKKFFRWALQTGVGQYQIFYGGWAIQVSTE